jgi:hypothetical protein
VFSHLANAFLPDAAKAPLSDETAARTALGNAGFDPSAQNIIETAFKTAAMYSTQTPREEVARGVMLLASGHTGPPATLNKRLGTYDITVMDDNGYAVHLTMPASEALNIHALGLKTSQALQDKQSADATRLGESQSWPTPPAPGGGAIPSQATPSVINPRPERLPMPTYTPNAQVPQDWKNQFPELNQ